MKRNIAILLLVFLAIVGSFCFLAPEVVALNATPHLKLYHSETKTFAVGKDVFTFRNFTQAENQATPAGFSVVEITVPPKDKSFLLEKHVNPTEETFYALAGQFEFFEQSSGSVFKLMQEM